MQNVEQVVGGEQGPGREGGPLFGDPRHRVWRLEDGERVVMLRAARRRCAGWRSDQPHAGLWGPGTAYVLVPTTGSVRRRAIACLTFDPALRDRSSDVEVLVLGSVEQIARLISSGPAFCRARVRPAHSPEALARLRAAVWLARASRGRKPTISFEGGSGVGGGGNGVPGGVSGVVHQADHRPVLEVGGRGGRGGAR